MQKPTLAFGLLTLLAPTAAGAPYQDAAYPPSTALAEGVSPEALAKLDALVQSLVDDDEVVGAELLVLKNGRSILHEGYGWRDREAQLAMQPGSVFCVRSMTKPTIAAAILMLAEERKLDLDDAVSKYLPSFDAPSTRGITIEQLLTHTGGLPMSLILSKDLQELEAQGGIRAVARLGGGSQLEYEPGSAFVYSDQGTDTLTAVVEVAGGMPAAEFVRTRVLAPLGMTDSACVLAEDSPLRARGCAKYLGARGSWIRFWGREDPPLFPFFLGSQGLYSTLTDYARFMDLWRNRGRSRSERLLRSSSVRKALKPGPHPMGGPTGLPELRADYGFLMQLWTGVDPEDAEQREVRAFGHTGSDGTHAWVFPEQDAMALYFTQSRNNTTGFQVEEALGELFLGVPFDANQAAPPFEQYLGYYWEGPGDMYRAIVRDGESMALEILDQTVVPLTYIGEDRWKLRPNPSIVLAFDRSEEGEVTGYHIGDHVEYRFDPAGDLPSGEEVAARVREVHGLHHLETVGPIRVRGKTILETLEIEGDTEVLVAWPNQFRYHFQSDSLFENLAFDGERTWSSDHTQKRREVEGVAAQRKRLDNLLVRFGDWSRWYQDVQPIQRIERSGKKLLLVRAGDTSAPAPTLGIDEETGRVVGEMSLIESGAGRMARRMQFGDFREVSGMLLPFETRVKFASPILGTALATVDEIELGIDVPPGAFTLED